MITAGLAGALAGYLIATARHRRWLERSRNWRISRRVHGHRHDRRYDDRAFSAVLDGRPVPSPRRNGRATSKVAR